MGSEFELKYKATPEILLAVSAAISGEVQHFDMHTTYYDTVHRLLSGRHWTLRRRLENGVSICTFKAPGADGARREFEVECDDIMEGVSALCKLSRERVLAGFASTGLVEVCGAKFHRVAITVQLEGAVAEVALDQGVLLGGGKELPLCELEVEQKSGDRNAVIAFATALAARFDLTPEPMSKFRRAANLAGGI